MSPGGTSKAVIPGYPNTSHSRQQNDPDYDVRATSHTTYFPAKGSRGH